MEQLAVICKQWNSYLQNFLHERQDFLPFLINACTVLFLLTSTQHRKYASYLPFSLPCVSQRAGCINGISEEALGLSHCIWCRFFLSLKLHCPISQLQHPLPPPQASSEATHFVTRHFITASFRVASALVGRSAGRHMMLRSRL